LASAGGFALPSGETLAFAFASACLLAKALAFIF